MRKIIVILMLLAAGLPGGAAQAGKGLSGAIALKFGGSFHGVFSGLDASTNLELEGGILLLNRRLEVDLVFGWAQPPASSAAGDSRLTGGDYTWKVYQDFFTLGLMARYRFFNPAGLFNFYVALGPRLYFLRTLANGASGGNAFGENRQYETRFGMVLAMGGEVRLGPGAILLEYGISFGDLDGLITGNTSSSTMDLLLGYRLLF